MGGTYSNIGYRSITLTIYHVIWGAAEVGCSQKEGGMRLFVVGWVLIWGTGVLGCAQRPYVICHGEGYCTNPLTHAEAMHAAQLKNVRGNDIFYVRPGQEER